MKKGTARLDAIFNALANQHRRAIIHHLSLQPASITELAKKGKLSLPAIHKHIRVLEETKLIQRKKSGRCNFLALNRDALLVLHDWVNQYHAYWGNNQESLKNYVERIERQS